MICATKRKKPKRFLLGPGIIVTIAGFVSLNNGTASAYIQVVIGILMTTCSIFLSVREPKQNGQVSQVRQLSKGGSECNRLY